MSRLPLVVAIIVMALIALVVLPSYAQPAPSAAASAYLAIVFRAPELPTASATAPAATTLATSAATPSVVTPTTTATALLPSPSATTGSPAFPPVGPGTPTRTPATKPIYTGGSDLWNCSDFSTWADSNVVYQANKPGDPNRLDQDDDGIPCETLPGVPEPHE